MLVIGHVISKRSRIVRQGQLVILVPVQPDTVPCQDCTTFIDGDVSELPVNTIIGVGGTALVMLRVIEQDKGQLGIRRTMCTVEGSWREIILKGSDIFVHSGP